MDDPADAPTHDAFIVVTLLGVLPVFSGELCPGCGDATLTIVVGYSTASDVVGIENAGFCEACDVVVYGDGWE